MTNALRVTLMRALICAGIGTALYFLFMEGSLLPLLRRIASTALSLDGNAGVQ